MSREFKDPYKQSREDASKPRKAYKKQKTLQMPWLLLAFSFVFMINPNISIIDPLPDFIGYIMISACLSKLSMLGETLADAKRAFDKMILIDLCKILSIVWVFGVDKTASRASTIMLFAFTLGILEILFLIPAYIKLFKGISDLGDYYENTAVHGSRNGRVSYTDGIRNFSIFFAIFKVAMNIIPELTAMGNDAYNETSVFVDIYRYIGIMRFLAAIPVVVLGIFWLVRIYRYFKRVSLDAPFNAALIDKYKTEVLPKRGVFVIKDIRKASWMLTIAAVLTLDFTLDGVNIMPDVLAVIFLILSAVYFERTTLLRVKRIYVLTGIYGVLSVVSYTLQYYYNAKFSYNALDSNFNAFCIYIAGVAAVALQGIILICLLSVYFAEIKKVIAEHTGYVAGREFNTESEKLRIKEYHDEIGKTFTRVLDVTVLYVISDVALSLYGVFYAFLRKNLGVLSLLNFACGLLFVAMLVRALGELRYAVQTKYMLE